MTRRLRVAIDIGGTFTDLVASDDDSDQLIVSKSPSTPPLFIDGVMDALTKAGIGPEEIVFFKHGSTIATNAIIERRGAKAGLITTKGMRDVLAAGRANRPDLFNSNWDPSPPLVQRRNVLEVSERVDYEGAVLTPLEEADVVEAARKFRARGIQSVAVSYLNSFMNAEHELRTRDILQKELGEDTFVFTSVETLPEIREFERTSTVAASAYLAPVIDRYLEGLVTRLGEWGYTGEISVTHSGGGMMSVPLARRTPARICQSGPAGGVIGGLVSARASGYENVMTFDMGGTSTDLSLVADGKLAMISEWRVDWNIPILFPAVDIVAIGAGGGTIAWVDPGGSLRSGPRSAGADPGPACIGKGNVEPTTTDAHVYLGRLDPARYLGGDIEIYPDLAEKAIASLADRLHMSTVEVANGILRIAIANMTSALHLISVQRGHDPRSFALVAGGGAGPLHAVGIARELGIPLVIVPRSPGLTSAVGILHADLRHDFQLPLLKLAKDLSPEEIGAVYASLLEAADERFEAEDIPADQRVIELSLDARYYGQTQYVNLVLEKLPTTPEEMESVVGRYMEFCLLEFGFVLPLDVAEVELVNARVAALGRTQAITVPRDATRGSVEDARIGARLVYFEEAGDFVDTAIYDRSLLRNGCELVGPAVVEQLDSTVVLPPRSSASVDEYLNIVVSVNGSQGDSEGGATT